MHTSPVVWGIFVGVVVIAVLYVRLNVVEARRLRYESERRAINKSDLSQLILEGDRARVRSLGIEVGR